jgi:hypothetical protein
MSDAYEKLYHDYRAEHHQRQLAFARAVIGTRRKYLSTDSVMDLRLTLATLHGAFMLADTAESMHELSEFKKEVEALLEEGRW